MKPENLLKSVVFIQAEIKTESDNEEINIKNSENDQNSHENESKHVVVKYEANSLSEEKYSDNDETSNKKGKKKKLDKMENANSSYELVDTDLIKDVNGQWTCNKCGLKYISRTRLVYHMRRSHNVSTNFKFKCEYCGFEYGRLEGLKKHIKRKHQVPKDEVNIPSNMKYTCKYCGSVYGFKQSLYRHMKFKHLLTNPNETLQICTFCPATFSQRISLLHHIKKKHAVDEVFCDQCGMKFLGKIELIHHIDNVHNENKSISDIKETEKFNHDVLLNIDGEIKWYKESFLSNGRKQCKFCDQILSNTNRMKYHIKTKHTAEFVKLKQNIDDIESKSKKFHCIICGQKYKNSVTLRFHVKLKHSNIKVTNDKLFTCEYCGLLFTSRTSLLYHLKKKHIDVEYEETKEKYGLVFVEFEKECLEKVNKLNDDGNPSEELIKVKKTTVEERYQCDLCSHTCKNLQSIKHHKIARHTSEKDHMIKCQHCEYTTKFKQYLHKHISMKHSDPNLQKDRITYVCEICGYKTQIKYRFKRHLDTHHKDKKNVCESSVYASNTQASLMTNLKIHSKEKLH